jgi:ribonuclease BN (tRNA processing enzyme)
VPWHLTAHEAGRAARDAKASQLMLTHIWPLFDPALSVKEGSESFGAPVMLAKPHLVTRL